MQLQVHVGLVRDHHQVEAVPAARRHVAAGVLQVGRARLADRALLAVRILDN